MRLLMHCCQARGHSVHIAPAASDVHNGLVFVNDASIIITATSPMGKLTKTDNLKKLIQLTSMHIGLDRCMLRTEK